MAYRTATTLSVLLLAVVCLTPAVAAPAVAADIPRTSDGHPDLSGTYDVATLTPLQRPSQFGDNLYLTREEAQAIEDAALARTRSSSEASDPNREAPPEGGDGSAGAAGNVGGYNSFWIDRGDDTFEIDGRFRTSIIVDPANGRRPPLTEEARERSQARRRPRRANTGEAWWLETGGQGPYDDPELRPNGERCLLGFGSTAGPPMLPVLYNNVKTIVQTPDHVMILVEMVHDARIVRMNSEHPSSEIRKWLGDSIGWWEGDTLVVDTTNFSTKAVRGGSETLHVVERFTRVDKDTLTYEFTVEDPSRWATSWTGEYPWPATDTRLYEYACHEANYALGNILRGARVLEADTLDAGSGN